MMARLLVVIRFKATDVSLSEVGCAPHLKKNSCKTQMHCQRPGLPLGIPDSVSASAVNELYGQETSVLSS